MIKTLSSLLGLNTGGQTPDQPEADSVQLATAALLTQMVQADFEVQPGEQEELRRGVASLLGNEPGDTEELLRLAKHRADESVSLFDFTQVLLDQLGVEDRPKVVELLWRIAFADGDIDPHEEHLVRKVSRLLHVSQTDFIAAKQRARADAGR